MYDDGFRVNVADDIVNCPRCGEAFLHQHDVQVFQRKHEDGPACRTRAPHGGADPEWSTDLNAPGRRDSLRISFYCEFCHTNEPDSDLPPLGADGAPFVLEILQHKGHTLLRWLPVGLVS